MEKSIGDLYAERVKDEAEKFAKGHLEDIKGFMRQDEYIETATEIMNTFLAGANCARSVLEDLVKSRKEGKI